MAMKEYKEILFPKTRIATFDVYNIGLKKNGKGKNDNKYRFKIMEEIYGETKD
mgnify:CR=1 FL=1